MDMPLMGNNCIAVVRADVKAARSRLPTPIQKRAARRSCVPDLERSSLRGLTRTFGVSRTIVSSWIKKKELSFLLCLLAYLTRIQRIPLPRRWNWTNGWLVCDQESASLLDLDCPVPQDTTGGRLCGGRSG